MKTLDTARMIRIVKTTDELLLPGDVYISHNSELQTPEGVAHIRTALVMKCPECGCDMLAPFAKIRENIFMKMLRATGLVKAQTITVVPGVICPQSSQHKFKIEKNKIIKIYGRATA